MNTPQTEESQIQSILDKKDTGGSKKRMEVMDKHSLELVIKSHGNMYKHKKVYF